jgi:hypothetical protein
MVTLDARRWCAWIGRAGYAASAAVYALVAVIALDAARRYDPHEPRGVIGALHRLAGEPGGRLLLGLLAAGLLSQAIWRGVQALGDLERLQGRPAPWWMRLGFAAVGVFYAALFVRALTFVFHVRHGGAGQKRSLVAAALTHASGRALVFAIGGGLVVFAVVELVRAWRASFLANFDRRALASSRRRAAVALIGRLGLAGRAIVFGAGGLMLARSALRARADTIGTGDVLRHLFAAPFGQTLVTIAAVGMLAYAAFMALEAAWRQSVQL